ncbi:EF hand domain-containing protein [Stella humosa]|uniref:EF hand domain-containing protein n=1 Tax=Stella humosa TaxID=94 RepID=A0A3N1MFH1_9PROT|nr:hypothetical protein [Stella humosa]ROQ01420.1 EF hand domain-containing protein [Stella humosa]
MTYRLLAAATALGLIASVAVAAPHGGNAFIRDYDTNGDGQVTRAEFDAVRDVRFKATDANGDGTLDEAEYVGEYTVRLDAQLAASDLTAEKKTEERQRQVRQAHVRFGALDKNKDQRIDRAEYDTSGAAAFAEQDDDKDGVVTLADAAARRAKRAAAAK